VRAVSAVLLRQGSVCGERRHAVRFGDTLEGSLSLREDVPNSLEFGQVSIP